MTQRSLHLLGQSYQAFGARACGLLNGADVDSANPNPKAFFRSLSSYSDLVEEPIRTIHHFACTGGTLICKALACMQNVHLLSEVEPFSNLLEGRKELFMPTDLVGLASRGSREVEVETIAAIFIEGLRALYERNRRKGLRLVLRDHAHSRFCFGSRVSDKPGLLESARAVAPVRSILTIRHPLDSYLSLRAQDWVAFEPASLEEYAVRYLAFIAELGSSDRYRYEAFVENPQAEARKMCSSLELPFNDSFERLFSVHRLSGDSGRSRSLIGPTARRSVPIEVEEQRLSSSSYHALCDELKYVA